MVNEDDLDAAHPHVKRAIEADARGTGEAQPVMMLLEARLLLYKGDDAGARAIARAIRDREIKARERGHEGAVMAPSEDVLCAMVELATSPVSDAGRGAIEAIDGTWDDLTARSAQCSIGQEHIEVLEMRALAALRRGRSEEARRRLQGALEAASRIPNVMEDRIRRRLAAAQVAPDIDLFAASGDLDGRPARVTSPLLGRAAHEA